jgi:tetratricopeptide (TPR) repeat protein
MPKKNMAERRHNRKKNVKRRTQAYRRLVIRYKIIAAVFIVVMLLLGIPNIFTKKQDYRKQGIELFDQGNFEEAIVYFQKSLDEKQWLSENVDADVLQYEAASYIRIENYSEAKQLYETLLSDYSDSYYDRDEAEYLAGLCDTLIDYGEGMYSDSLDGLKGACDKGYTELAIYVAVCSESVQNYDDMKYYLDLYVQSNPKDAYVYLKYADMYIATGDYSQAVANVESALALNDGTYMQELYYRQILCYEKLSNYEKAYELSENYVSNYPGDERGVKLNDYLLTRTYPDTEVVNDIFGVNEPSDEEASSEENVGDE